MYRARNNKKEKRKKVEPHKYPSLQLEFQPFDQNEEVQWYLYA